MEALDSIVEQIAFGKVKQTPSSSLGLYLSPEMVYLSETHLRDGKVVVDHLVRIPIPAEAPKAPGAAAATMNTDFLTDPAKVAGVVRQSMSQLRWNTKSVRVTLSHHLGLLRYFTMPMVEKRFLRNAVPLEAKKYIPIPFDVLAHDFQAVPLPPDAAGKPRLGILIAVTQKKNIENVRGLLKNLDLQCSGIEVAPTSVLRLWQRVDPPKDPAPFVHIHADGANVRVMVCDRGVPVFFREIFLSSDATIADLRKIDMTGSLSFVQKQLGLSGMSRLRISGNVPSMDSLKEALAAESKLQATVQDTPKLLSIKSGDWGGYASLGSAISALAPSGLTLDLAAEDRVTDDERRTARDLMLAGALGGLIFAGMGLVTSGTYAYNHGELTKWQQKLDPDVGGTLQGQDPSSIENMLKDMQSQLDALRAVTGVAKPKVSAVLLEIIKAMPEKVWLDQVQVVNPLMGADKQPFTLHLRGHAMDRSVSDEQTLCFAFKEALLKSPMGKDFEISLSLQNQQHGADASAQPGSPGMDPKSLAEKLEERTLFSMDMRAKK